MYRHLTRVLLCVLIAGCGSGSGGGGGTAAADLDPNEPDPVVAARTGNLAAIKSLVSADPGLVNELDQQGQSLLHYAASYRHVEVVRYLLEQGADPNMPNADGETPIYYAEESPGTEEVIEVLIEYGGSA